MNKTLVAGFCATLAVTAPAVTTAETLTLGSGGSVLSPVVKDVIAPWVDKVNAEAGDALKIKLRNGKMLVNFTNFVDRLTDDVVQITWGLPVYQPSNFPRSLVSTLPLTTQSSAASALAFCRLYENGDLGAEWEQFVPLLYVPFPQVSAHLNGSPLKSMEDLAGKKIMTGSPTAAGIIKSYGGIPLSIQLPEQYQALQRGAADGTFMSYSAFRAFKLDEVTTDHLHAPLGGATGVVFMMKSKFDSLSPEAQAVLKANSGCELAAKTGATVDRWESGGLEYTKEAEGQTFTEFDAASLEALTARVQPNVISGFDTRVPGGADLIATWNAALKQAEIDAPEIVK